MIFHVCALPHTQTTKEYVHCAYTEKVRKFCNMMKQLGHTVYLYASEENEANCDELINCITKEEQRELIGIEMPIDNLKVEFSPELPYWQKMNERIIGAIQQRATPKDFICLIAGLCQESIASAFPEMLSVEFGIGYGGVFAPYKVFESYAWMHTVYGSLEGTHSANGHFYDTVIPNSYEIADFPFSETKDDYFLYLGRLTDRKGYKIAVESCKRLGVRLIVAGQGEPPDYGEYVGVVGVQKRAELLSKARAVFVPTTYIEPFGGVAVEAMLCGTPVITTDFGAFTETVIHGLTGYRCSTLREFITAATLVDTLDRKKIHQYAQRYSCDTVKYDYQDYFERLSTLWQDGWYTI